MKKFVLAVVVFYLCMSIIPAMAVSADDSEDGYHDYNCFCIAVGKNASPTGYPIIVHNEDDGGRLTIKHGWVPTTTWPSGTTVPTNSGRAVIPQLSKTFGFWWTSCKGGAAGLQNADSFLNENGVSLVSNSNANSKESAANAKLTDGGIEYNLRRIVAERATSARHGIEVIIEMLNTYGYAPSGRAYTIGDYKEIWQIQIVMGNKYVAVRVPDDHVLIMSNHYTIHKVTQDYGVKGVDILYPDDLISYAKSRGWFPAASADSEFDFAASYQNAGQTSGVDNNNYDPNQAGAGTYKTAGNTYRHAFGQHILLGENINPPASTSAADHNAWAAGRVFNAIYKVNGKLSFDTLRAAITSHYEGSPMDAGPRVAPGNEPHNTSVRRICTATTIESKIIQFHPNLALTTLWTAYGRPCELPYIPLHPLATRIPEIVELANPAEALKNHLIHEPERMLYVDNAWQKFREFEYMLDLTYDKNIKDVSALLSKYFTEMQLANSAFILYGNASLAAEFDKAALDRALSALKDYVDNNPLLGIPVAATTYIDRLNTAQVSVDIVFELPAGKIPSATNLRFQLGGTTGTNSTSAFIPDPGSLKDLGGGKWQITMAKANLVSNNISTNAAGPYEFCLGGRTTDNDSFAGIAILLFTDGVAVHSVRYYNWDGKELLKEVLYVKEGETVTPPADPKRNGYKFTGWKEESDANGNLIYTAQYEIDLADIIGCDIGLFALALMAVIPFVIRKRK